jgi:hypothetical protein
LKAQKEINRGHKEEDNLKEIILDKYIVTGDLKDVVRGKDILVLASDAKINYQQVPLTMLELGVQKKKNNKGSFYLGIREKTVEEKEKEKEEIKT